MASKKKTATSTSSTSTTAARKPRAEKDAPVTAKASANGATPVAAPAKVPVAAPVAAAAPAKAPVVAAPVVAAAPAKAAAATSKAAVVRNGPVDVILEKAANAVKARIRYAGSLADQDRLVARVGVEWFGGPRWQASRDVELTRVSERLHEAVVELEAEGNADLMALQLAFSSPDHQAWDSAGVPYGYYQVSALNGAVERWPQDLRG